MSRISLAELQHRFSEAVRIGNTDGLVLEKLGIVNQGSITSVARMEVYQIAYQIRMHAALEEDFPEMLSLLGESHFGELVDGYLDAFPSTSWTLAERGESLGCYVRESEWGEKNPRLADLAELEWYRILANHAESVKGLKFTDLSHLTHDEIQTVVMGVAPSVFFFRSHSAGLLLVYRKPSGEVIDEKISEEQWILLKRISEGMAIPQIVDLLPDTAPETVTEWFSHWAAEGIIIRLDSRGGT